MRVAAVNWKIKETHSIDEFFGHCERLIKQCDGADLVVLPEYVALRAFRQESHDRTEGNSSFLSRLDGTKFENIRRTLSLI